MWIAFHKKLMSSEFEWPSFLDKYIRRFRIGWKGRVLTIGFRRSEYLVSFGCQTKVNWIWWAESCGAIEEEHNDDKEEEDRVDLFFFLLEFFLQDKRKVFSFFCDQIFDLRFFSFFLVSYSRVQWPLSVFQLQANQKFYRNDSLFHYLFIFLHKFG